MKGGIFLKIAIAGFKGSNNSAKIFIDKFSLFYDKIYLQNNKNISVEQMILSLNQYDYIFAFGEKPLIKNKICIEICGQFENMCLVTTYPINDIMHFFNGKYNIKLSQNPGTSYCNNLYFNALKYIKENNLNTKMLFIHIPMLKNISDIDVLIAYFESYITYSKLFTE